jgi:uncharacterized protein (TIGR02246 family)
MQHKLRVKSATAIAAGALLGILAVAYLGTRTNIASAFQPTATPAADDRPADREAIARLVQEFTTDFGRGNAPAAAALYTEQCEYYDDTTGETFRGCREVEKAYAELFRERPGSKIEVQSKSLRFVGRDTAIAEGLARVQPAGSELPRSTRYSCVLVREDGQWKVALERDWGADEGKLEDLSWLIGDWKADAKNREVQTSFRWNAGKTLIVNKCTVKEAGQVTANITQRIGIDPQTGQIHSWIIDGKGGRGQAVWVRDGNNWLMDATSVLAGGVETSSVNIFARLSDDAFTWRSVDRRIGGEEVPATDPIKVVRQQSGK